MSGLAAVVLSGTINSLWSGLLLTALAAVALRLIPRSNATTRYAIWFTTLILILAMPALFLLVPPASPGSTAAVQPTAAVALPEAAAWPMYAVWAWMAITAGLLARVALSIRHIRALKRHATLLGTRDGIGLLASTEIRVPMAAGFVRRAVIFPQALLRELSAAEYEQVLCHELAHLRRFDDWTQLVQAAAQAVLFFHPAVYWIGRKLALEREIACDDWVLGVTGKARPYAACLTHLHELTRRAAAPRLAPGAIAGRRGQIVTRVEALLEVDRNASARFSRAGWLAACGLVSAALVVATQVAPPVGVEAVPVAPIQFARIAAPGAPAIARTPARATPVRHHLMAKRAPPFVGPPTPEVLLVRAVRFEPQPGYVIITVVFFAPPPPLALNGI